MGRLAQLAVRRRRRSCVPPASTRACQTLAVALDRDDSHVEDARVARSPPGRCVPPPALQSRRHDRPGSGAGGRGRRAPPRAPATPPTARRARSRRPRAGRRGCRRSGRRRRASIARPSRPRPARTPRRRAAGRTWRSSGRACRACRRGRAGDRQASRRCRARGRVSVVVPLELEPADARPRFPWCGRRTRAARRGRAARPGGRRGSERAAAACARLADALSARLLSVDPSTASCAQSPRYSIRIQVSTRLAVAASGSACATDVSAQRGLVVQDEADHLPARDRVPGCDRQAGDPPGAVGDDLVLHLHRLDDADDLPVSISSPSATSTFSTVPCIGVTTASLPAPPGPWAARSRRRRASSAQGGSGSSTVTS